MVDDGLTDAVNFMEFGRVVVSFPSVSQMIANSPKLAAKTIFKRIRSKSGILSDVSFFLARRWFGKEE